MNYLILTPDGVGSTYLQRALTVYLQCADLDYWNTHELLNGLGCKDGSLYKDWDFGYDQSVTKICDLLFNSKNMLVSRIASYHIYNRLQKRQEDYNTLYGQCAQTFECVLMCERDPFEYALSWGIRDKSKKLNVYSVRERIATHSVDHKEPVDLEYFSAKLKQYSDYEYWAEDNFDITHCVDYDDLHNDADTVLANITGVSDTVSNSMGLSLQEYSRFRYLSSMYAQTKDAKYIDNACIEKLEHMFELHYKIQDLHYRLRLPTTMPIKMNTMADKRSRVTNFDQALEIYNTWASVGNRHPEITTECIDKKIINEEQIYVDK